MAQTWLSLKKQLEKLPDVINDFIEKVNLNSQREGMSTKLIKNHLYFHLTTYIEMWGPPNGWDATSNESNNKIIIKAPAKNTQQRAPTINLQTTLREFENNKIRDALQHWNVISSINKSTEKRE